MVDWAPVLVLVGATVLWGSTFVVTKDAIAGMGVWGLLLWRFGGAGLLLLALAGPRLRQLSAADVRHGVVVGVLLGLGFGAQTQGLATTSASVNGFVTGLMVVLTPLVARVAFGRRFNASTWGAVALATLGLAVLSWQGGGSGVGVMFSVLGATLFAGQIAGLSQWSAGVPALPLTAVEVVTAFAVTAVAAAVTGQLTPPGTTANWLALGYLAVGATVVGLLAQVWAQGRLSAARAAVIMTLEPVFAGVFAVAAGEALTGRLVTGGLAIVAAMILVEVRGD